MTSVALNEHFEDLIRRLIEKGRFNNASEVVRAGLRLLEDVEAAREERLRQLDAGIARGLADAEAGRTKPAEDVLDRLEAKYRALADKRSA